MTALGTTRLLRAVLAGGTTLRTLKHHSAGIARGAVFAPAFMLVVAAYALWVVAGAAFLAIPAVLGILTMEFKRVRPCPGEAIVVLPETTSRRLKP